jgi:hypothetical protein
MLVKNNQVRFGSQLDFLIRKMVQRGLNPKQLLLLQDK